MPAVLPGLVVVALGFRAGGYFAGTTALGAVLGLLAVVLVLQLAARPFAGVGGGALVAVGSLAGLAAWSLLSASWSGSTARALVESDRYLLYAVLVLLGATAARVPGRLRMATTSVAAGIVVVAGAGVLTRLLPSILTTAAPRNPERLSFPLTYWNGLGVLAAAGIVLCIGLTCSAGSRRAVRGAAAAAVPLLGVTLYLTLARGPIAALAVGLVALAVVGRSVRLFVAGLAVALPTALAVGVAYSQDVITSSRYGSAQGITQGRHLLLVLMGCMVAAALLRLGLEGVERKAAAWRPRHAPSRRTVVAGAAGAVVAAVVVAVALGAPHTVRTAAKRFADSSSVPRNRSRLTSVNNNGRIAHWRVAVRTFRDHPLLGSGAGTYATEWARERRTDLSVLHAHSAYLGVMSDLGLPGVLLLLAAVLALLAGLLARARGPDRLLGAAAFAAALTWALHAGIDWDLEMPATGAWVFVLGGVALARPAGHATGRSLSPTMRLAAGVAVLVLAVTPALVAVSQGHIGASVSAFERGNCPRAIDQAVAANGTLGLRPEPYEILGFCDVRLGNPKLGVAMMQRAVDRDPDWWEYRYGLALVQGAAGLDPRPAAAAARRLNPRNESAHQFSEALRGTTRPEQWRRLSLKADLPMT